jgi:hypothetical protein
MERELARVGFESCVVVALGFGLVLLKKNALDIVLARRPVKVEE